MLLLCFLCRIQTAVCPHYRCESSEKFKFPYNFVVHIMCQKVDKHTISTECLLSSQLRNQVSKLKLETLFLDESHHKMRLYRTV